MSDYHFWLSNAQFARLKPLMIDTTHLKAHRTATNLLKKGFFTDASSEPEAA